MVVFPQEVIDAIAEAVAAKLPAKLKGSRDDRPLLTVAQLAERLGVSERQVRQMLSDGEIPSFLVGTGRRVDAVDLDAYLSRQRAARGGTGFQEGEGSKGETQ